MFKRLTVKRNVLNDKEVVATGQFRKKGSTVKNWKIRNYILTQDKMLMYFDPNSNNDKEKGSLLLDYDFSVLEGKKSNINESVNSCGALDNEIGVALSIQISKKTLELVFQSVDDTVNFIAGLMQVTESPIYLNSYKSICTYLTMQKANDPKRWENHILKLFDKPINKSDEKIEVCKDSVSDVNNSESSTNINSHINDINNQRDSYETVIGVKEVNEINYEITTNDSIIVDEKVDSKVDNISENPIEIYNSDFTIVTNSNRALSTNNEVKVEENFVTEVSDEAITTSDLIINEQSEEVNIDRTTNEQLNESQMNLSLSKSLTDEDYDYNDRFSASTINLIVYPPTNQI